jgi:hypothetical protein
MVNWGVVIPIIVALVPLTGVFGPILISNYIQSLNKPSVDIVIKRNNADNTKTIIELSNDGLVSATNLSLAVESPEIITSVTKKSGAADVILPQLPKNNQKLKLGMPEYLTGPPVSFLELEIPRLAHGPGSLIELEILNNKSTSYPYTSVATFDQGSSEGSYLPASERLGEMFSFTGGSYFSSLLFIYYIIFGTILFYYMFRRSRKRVNKERFKDFISLIRDQIMTVHSTIKMDPMTQHDFDDFIQTWRQKSVPIATISKKTLYDFIQVRRQKNYSHIIKKIIDYMDMKDYIIIENLYAKLLKRISYIKKHSDPKDIKRYNNDSLKLVEKTLKNINWKKYL